MRAPDAVRLVAALGAVEMALVRRDPVAGPLLAQASRAAAGLAVGPWLAAAAELARAPDLWDDAPPARARRKALQALCRAGAQTAQAQILGAAATAAIPGGTP
jgi:hypothetical protein